VDQSTDRRKKLNVRLTYRGTEPRYRITLGIDPAYLNLFGQVEDLAWKTDGLIIDETPIRSDLPTEGMLLWLGANQPVTLQELVQAVAPYGPVPLSMQLQLLTALDAQHPFSLLRLTQELGDICQQAPTARLTIEPPEDERVFLVLNERGWHMHTLPRNARTSVQQFAQILFPWQPAQVTPLVDILSDPTIRIYKHVYGFCHELPLFALVPASQAVCGPAIITGSGTGLTAEQVQIVQREVLYVDESIRLQVTTLWYHAWQTLLERP
jgi:hypothetical protein